MLANRETALFTITVDFGDYVTTRYSFLPLTLTLGAIVAEFKDCPGVWCGVRREGNPVAEVQVIGPHSGVEITVGSTPLNSAWYFNRYLEHLQARLPDGIEVCA